MAKKNSAIPSRKYSLGSGINGATALRGGMQLVQGRDPLKVGAGIAVPEISRWGVSNLGSNFYSNKTGKFTSAGSGAVSALGAGAGTLINGGDIGQAAENAAWAGGKTYATDAIASKFGGGYGAAASTLFSVGSQLAKNGQIDYKQTSKEAVGSAMYAVNPAMGLIYSAWDSLVMEPFASKAARLSYTPIFEDGTNGSVKRDKNGRYYVPKVTGYKEGEKLKGFDSWNNAYNQVYMNEVNRLSSIDNEFATNFSNLQSNYNQDFRENTGGKSGGYTIGPDIRLEGIRNYNPVDAAKKDVEKLSRDMKHHSTGYSLANGPGLYGWGGQSKNNTERENMEATRNNKTYKFASAVRGEDPLKEKITTVDNKRRVNDAFTTRYQQSDNDSSNSSIDNRRKREIAEELDIDPSPYKPPAYASTNKRIGALSWMSESDNEDSWG